MPSARPAALAEGHTRMTCPSSASSCSMGLLLNLRAVAVGAGRRTSLLPASMTGVATQLAAAASHRHTHETRLTGTRLEAQLIRHPVPDRAASIQSQGTAGAHPVALTARPRRTRCRDGGRAVGSLSGHPQPFSAPPPVSHSCCSMTIVPPLTTPRSRVKSFTLSKNNSQRHSLTCSSFRPSGSKFRHVPRQSGRGGGQAMSPPRRFKPSACSARSPLGWVLPTSMARNLTRSARSI